ncbi:MAG TPA: TolC family protein [Cyclobacteriaceae bacterium]|nr:TolC family protein [Cyclobacteriaceae bacterium]
MKVSLAFAFLCIFISVLRAPAQDHVSLEDAIVLALQKNYDVQLSRNISESAATDDSYAWAAYMPQLNAVGSAVWNNNQQKLEFQDETRNNSGDAQSNVLNGSVQLNWLLFDGTRMFATRERIRQIAEQGEIAVKAQMVNTVADVIVNYHGIVRQKQQLKALEEQMAVSEERVKLAEKKLEVGTGGKPELLQAKVDLNAFKTQVIQQEALIIQFKETLNELTGLQLSKSYDVADTIIIDLNLNLDDIQNNIENSNFDLLAAKRNFEIAQLSLRERKAELSPTISFNASYNYGRTDNQKLINPFAALLSTSQGYNYGFSINVPIFNALNTRRLIEQAHIDYGRQEILYQQQKANVDVGLRNAFVNYDNAKKVLLIEEENILLAKENVFIALEGFKRGITTFIELRTAQQSLADGYNRLINARFLAKVAETELLRLKGTLIQWTE